MTNSETEELRQSFRDVLDDVVANDVRRHVDVGAARFDALWKIAADLGWFMLLTPADHDGLGLSRAAAAVLYEELGRVTAPLPIMGSLAATEIIARFGSEAQQAAWLPRLANGQSATFRAGPTSFSVGPELHLDQGVLRGEARDLLEGAEASLLVTEAASASGASWVLASTEDFAIERTELVDRTRWLAQARIAGAQASVLAPSDAVGRALRTHLAIGVACDSIGGAKAVLELTLEYLKMREQFGKPIGSFQALKHRCAEHKVAIEAADALLADAVRRWTSDDPQAELYAMLAKALVCDVYATVSMDAVQLHGGIGFTWEHACHLYLKRAKLNQALFGASAACRDAAARLLVS